MYFDTDILLKCSEPTIAGGSCSCRFVMGYTNGKQSLYYTAYRQCVRTLVSVG